MAFADFFVAASSAVVAANDVFGVKMIYPTRAGGEIYHMYDADFNPSAPLPNSDPRLVLGSAGTLTQNADKSWKTVGSQYRIGMLTSTGFSPPMDTYDHAVWASRGYAYAPNDWKNVEITAFFRINGVSVSTDDISLYSRGGRHTSEFTCEGVKYSAVLRYDDGFDRYSKEQWHSGGYTHLPWVNNGMGNLIGRSPLFGFKQCTWNKANGNPISQTYVNNSGDKQTWELIREEEDTGGWGDEGLHCGGNTPDQKVIWGGPVAAVRGDSVLDHDLRFMSCREIQPPS